MSEHQGGEHHGKHDFLNGIVRQFLDTSFSIILIIVSLLIGVAALLVTPAEEDPQIVVPMADVIVSRPWPLGRPGRAAHRHAPGEDPLSHRWRRIRLQHGPREPGNHHRPVLRWPGPGGQPGQALQEARREPGHRPAGSDRLDRQTGRDRRCPRRHPGTHKRHREQPRLAADRRRTGRSPRRWPMSRGPTWSAENPGRFASISIPSGFRRTV